ncbi:shikimate dehydrogenase (NADP(+)) [Actinoplanes italicus]|uniref:Shikimate dehydrogenase (NADP(+)) n=1 Tax=Actinoplanes italicus TaxID=113567 RepID=A0A2T0KEU1_9ACTN|nr:shikimate dehydrogenase [Actinoplanes italicus]PRX21899.1 shikimate dehydrogenase [Actinoplanes italicus]GIE29684.1 shikimate dehydrogenase (NADP(+)) [Actinoplanes italicus]
MGHVLIGLVGAGIGQSHSPLLHQHEAARHGIRLLYTTIDSHDLGLNADDLPGLLRWARLLGYRGLNVTHPFKQSIVGHLDDLSAEARLLGAVNTVVFDDRTTKGHNTDGYGFRTSFAEHFPHAPREHVVQLGAGGAGSAVAHAMLALGAARLTIVDVDPDRADILTRTLAARFGSARVTTGVPGEQSDLLAGADGVINATPTGMAHHPGTPVDPADLRPGLWVADLVYRPADTELLKAARAAGAPTLPGAPMSVHQAVAAFELFTGVPADPGAMLADSAELLRTGG